MSSLYKRKYRFAIETFRGDIIEIPQQLRVTFRAESTVLNYYSTGEITIYNLSADTESDIFKNAKKVIIEAGYENGAYGVVFSGPVRQPLRGKENGTDYFVRLMCINDTMQLGFCSLVLTAGQTAETIMNQIARSSTVPFDIRVNGQTSTQKTERAKTIFGPTQDALRNVAVNNNGFVYTDSEGKANFDALSAPPSGNIPFLNYRTGLIGTPQQVEQGIQFQCLINPSIKLASWVELNNQDILQAEIPLQGLQTLLEVDGRYRVIEIVCTGDTRGQEWYFDCHAIGANNSVPLMLQLPGQQGV